MAPLRRAKARSVKTCTWRSPWSVGSTVTIGAQIRQQLGDASDAVIQQFERWWDKYGVSLAQIDAEVEEAEAVMHGYLRELGYE